MSPSAEPESNPSPYWNPEHPPPWIASRRTSVSASGSSAMSSLTFAAASGVRETMGVGSVSRGVLYGCHGLIVADGVAGASGRTL